ncbi:hypothetical protein IW261DRAFT_1076985 [Armillaria novae-zelandiae]|uniref:Uncharacterized protein n=1 Tax=Armillaria novae-zelandiae TaxID=153914 RepID=A0AA39PC46_9AGAR|nr:hypothetical protein IW261DRAFT_1076985 [Armillaria novae-zelandiae]
MAGISLPQFSPIKRKRDRKDPARRIGDPAYDYARRALLKRIREMEDRARKRAEGAEDEMKTMHNVKPTQDGPHDEHPSQRCTGQSAKTQSEQTLYRPGRGEKRVTSEDPGADDDFQPIDSKPKNRRNGSKRQRNVSSIPSSSKNVADASTVRATATGNNAVPTQGPTGAQGMHPSRLCQLREALSDIQDQRCPTKLHDHAESMQDRRLLYPPSRYPTATKNATAI